MNFETACGCAHTTRGYSIAEPPKSVMNSRRRIRSLSGRPVSALGHQRTFHEVRRMSALPPKVDIAVRV